MDRIASRGTRALVAGVLAWQDTSLANYPTDRRKDRELAETLVRCGVPAEQVTLLLDEQVTRARFLRSLREASAAVPSGGLLVVYYAGHGLRRKGRAYFANHDVDTDAVESTGLAVEGLGQEIARCFDGAGVLLLADCCYSGNLARVVEELSTAGIPAASLSSAAATNASTGNWTFTQTIIDGLNGNDLANRNVDGVITLSEVRAEVADAMKHRERQRSGWSCAGFPEELVFAHVDARVARANAAVRGRFPIASYLEALDGGGYRTARVVEVDGDSLLARFYDYNQRTDRWISAAETRPIAYRHYPVGTPVQVEWKREYYGARVVELESDFHLVKFDDWSEAWNEWVLDDRLKAGIGEPCPAPVPAPAPRPAPAPVVVAEEDDDEGPVAPGPDSAGAEPCEVLWNDEWYPARLLYVAGPLHRITYDGYDSSWDEYVPRERIRFPA